MLIIKGVFVSEETIVEALKKHMDFKEPKPEYIFKNMDVVRFKPNSQARISRLIVVNQTKPGHLKSIDRTGCPCAPDTNSNFRGCNYEKVATFNELCKFWEQNH